MFRRERRDDRVRPSPHGAGRGSSIVIYETAVEYAESVEAALLPILLGAFILRRVALLSEVENDLVLLGSPHSGATLRLEEFLTRNGQPFTYAEVEGDPAVLEATAPGGQAGTSSRIEN